MKTESENILKKFDNLGDWKKRIVSLKVEGIHGFKNKEINFNYPITVIAGENGTGKSTILKSLACAFSGKKFPYAPGYLFPKTFWDDYKKAEITYKFLLDGVPKQITINKPTYRWRTENKISGNCLYLDVNRIKSLESLEGYIKLAKENIKEIETKNISVTALNNLSEIMARQYNGAKFVKTDIDSKKEIGVLDIGDANISQFHQGTGESIILNFLSEVESLPNNSLLLIDEIESSLHPRAQKKLVKKLIELSINKKIQIIFTTHSEYILNEVPREFRILLKRISNNELEAFYGPTTEFCLTEMDDAKHHELLVGVEDNESVILIKNILRKFGNKDMFSRLAFVPLGSDTHVDILENLFTQGKLSFITFIGIVDSGSDMKNTLHLPGTLPPEKQIIYDLLTKEKLEYIKAFISNDITLAEIKKEFSKATSITNHHKWIESLSNYFQVNEETLWDNLSRVWVDNCLEKKDIDMIVNKIKERLKDAGN